jgi:predicted permease
MDQIVGIVVPVFGLIGIGYALASTRALTYETGEALGDFVFSVAIPVLIFRTIATADFSAGEPWRLWLPFFAAFALAWIAGTALIRRGFGRDHRAGLVGGIAAAYGNTVLIGLPLVLAAYGPQGAVPLALIIALHMPVMMAASAVMIGRAERLDTISSQAGDMRAAALAALRHLATSPIIIGIAAGGLWRLTGVPLGGVGGDLVGRIADVAGTLALIAMGMSVRRYGVKRNVAAGLALAALKLLLMPALVLLAAGFMGLPPVWAKVAVIAAACPTGVNSYLVAGRFRTGEALASNAIAISTGLAVLTTAFWLNVVAWALPS